VHWLNLIVLRRRIRTRRVLYTPCLLQTVIARAICRIVHVSRAGLDVLTLADSSYVRRWRHIDAAVYAKAKREYAIALMRKQVSCVHGVCQN
jgi:hypothetical protein